MKNLNGKPDFFLVGAPKCGTKSMRTYLQKHPEIFMPKATEIHYFGSDLKFNIPRQITLKDYLSLFTGARYEKRVGEKSVYYLYSKQAATEIKEFNPRARILIMLRNPIDMIYSLHSQLMFSSGEDIKDFKTALNLEKQRKRGINVPKKTIVVQSLFYRAQITSHKFKLT